MTDIDVQNIADRQRRALEYLKRAPLEPADDEQSQRAAWILVNGNVPALLSALEQARAEIERLKAADEVRRGAFAAYIEDTKRCRVDRDRFRLAWTSARSRARDFKQGAAAEAQLVDSFKAERDAALAAVARAREVVDWAAEHTSGPAAVIAKQTRAALDGTS